MKTLNYLNYYTFRLLCILGKGLFLKPLLFIFPKSKAKKEAAENSYDEVMNDIQSGFNASFSLMFMFSTIVVLIATLCLYLVEMFNLSVRSSIYPLIIFVCVTSYLINYFCLRHKSRYIKYAREFEKLNGIRRHLLTAVLFHTASWSVFVISFYLFLYGKPVALPASQ